MSNLRVRDLMTTDVYAVGPEAPVTALQGLMDEKRIRHVPVVDDDGALLGLVSERDVLRYTFLGGERLPLSSQVDLLMGVRVGDIMTPEVQTVQADDDLAVAARIMLDNKYGCLPVFDDGVLAGIITESDFVRLVADEADDELDEDEDEALDEREEEEEEEEDENEDEDDEDQL